MPGIKRTCTPRGFAIACIICLSAAVISACSSRYSVFVDAYESEAKQINKVVLIHDATILSAISRHNHLVHEDRSIEALEWINSSVTEIVEQKGYEISSRTVWSVGLTFKPETSVLVYHGNSDEAPGTKTVADVNQMLIPIYLDSNEFDDASIAVLSDLHWRISWLKDEEDWEDIVYRNVRSLELPADTVLLITQSVGIQVPWGVKVGLFFYKLLEGMLTQGAPTKYSASMNLLFPQKVEPGDSDTSVHLFAILNHRGKLLWADVFEEMGGNRGEKTLENGLERLFSKLPDHPSKSK